MCLEQKSTSLKIYYQDKLQRNVVIERKEPDPYANRYGDNYGRRYGGQGN